LGREKGKSFDLLACVVVCLLLGCALLIFLFFL
jgi:hypothetical protein